MFLRLTVFRLSLFSYNFPPQIHKADSPLTQTFIPDLSYYNTKDRKTVGTVPTELKTSRRAPYRGFSDKELARPGLPDCDEDVLTLQHLHLLEPSPGDQLVHLACNTKLP